MSQRPVDPAGPKSAPPGRALDADRPSPASEQPGERIGPYRLVRLLGEGTGGRVFEVVHEALGRRAALKLLGAAQAARPRARARFLAEALSVNQINHPHIVEITDFIDTPEQQALVMELLEGESLKTAMARGPLPPARFLPILADVCAALAAAHAAGFVHRDLKPENIFLCRRPDGSDFVKLMDFGVAVAISPSSDALPPGNLAVGRPSTPRPGTFVGTPAYASPEQASGAQVDHTTDIYAVGVILYELASGRLPFEGWTAGQFVIQHLSAPAPRLPAELRATPLGRALDAIVQGCMAKQPAYRFASAAELSATFAAWARSEPTPSSTGVPRLTPRRLGRRFWRAAMLVLAACALSGFFSVRFGEEVRGRARVAERPLPPPAHGSAVVPAQRAAPPAVVAIVFESEPAGAEVRRVADGELLGVTPFRRAFPRGSGDLTIEITHTGYEPARVVVPTSAGRTLSATLAPRPERRARTARRGPRRLGGEKTIDPFRR